MTDRGNLVNVPSEQQRAELAAQVVEGVQALSTTARRVAAAYAEQQGLHPTDLDALLAVMHAEAHGLPLTSGGLGAQLGITSGAVTGLVDRLEATGHLERHRDPEDRRRVLLRHSPRGQQAGEDFFGPLGAATDSLLGELDDAGLAAVAWFLPAMAEVMRTHRSRGSGGS